MPVLSVGPGQTYTTIAAAIAASQDGDVIQVQAGTYTDDFSIINTKVTIEGVGGMVHMVAQNQPDNGKAIFVVNTDVTINNFEFSDVTVADGNGAGIRQQAGNLVINNCVFQDNQDGLLSTADSTATLTINNTEFSHNGTGDGFTHNLYVGGIGTLTVNNVYSHDADEGHEIKSRALNTIIQNSTIVDGAGTASYSIDLPNGGNATISDNFIQQGTVSDNPIIIHYGGEGGAPYASSSLTVSDNTIVNDLVSNSSFAILNQTTLGVDFIDNKVFGLDSDHIDLGGTLHEFGTQFLTVEPAIPCFAEGALITTERGEVPVETVQVGDRLPVLFGGPTQEVVWVGRRRVDCRRHPSRAHVWPVLIFAGAFGAGQPRRNLWLSPEHAVYINEVLVPVRLLINHRSILQVPVSSVAYYHVELARHDVLLAEGLAVESYLDTGNRAAFGIGREVVTLHAEFALRKWEADGCAPLVFGGPRLEAARRRCGLEIDVAMAL